MFAFSKATPVFLIKETILKVERKGRIKKGMLELISPTTPLKIYYSKFELIEKMNLAWEQSWIVSLYHKGISGKDYVCLYYTLFLPYLNSTRKITWLSINQLVFMMSKIWSQFMSVVKTAKSKFRNGISIFQNFDF